jgi:DNA-directed RNA polymerase subunit omega
MGLDDEFDSNYRYVLVAARRARQLLSGARPTIDTATRKPCKIAQEEIKAGKVHWNAQESPKSPVEAASELLDKAVEPESKEDKDEE